MNVLVTGGCGYLGNILIPRMLRYDNFDLIRILDKRILYLREHPKFEFIKGDIRDRDMVIAALDGIDSVVHLAALRQSQCKADWDEAWEVNYQAAGWLALLADNCDKFIFASSCSIYGNQDILANENTEARPFSTYARTKEAAEESIREMNDNAVILRFATMFGVSPCMRSDLIVNSFVRDAVAGNVLSVYDPNAQRALLHVEDAARAVIHFLSLPCQEANTFNVGGLNASKSEMIDCIRAKIPDVKVEIESSGDPRNYAVSFERMAKAGFFPSGTLERGISELIQEYRRIWKDNANE